MHINLGFVRQGRQREWTRATVEEGGDVENEATGNGAVGGKEEGRMRMAVCK